LTQVAPRGYPSPFDTNRIEIERIDMPNGTAERQTQTAADMIKELLPGKVRIGVAIYDQPRGRTYRAVTDGEMVEYLQDVTPAQIKRLWKLLEGQIRDESSWR
jgi:hypothetical protein